MKNEKLRTKQNRRNRKSFILLLVLCLGIGFAYFTSNLTINGNTSVSGNKWSVYFNKVDITEGSVEASVEPTVTGTTTTSLDYTVLLDLPGDFYEFTVEAKNAGTIDAMIDSITMTTLETDVAKYLSYTATYEDGTELKQNDVLEANSSVNYIVRVEYKKDISASDLDEDGANLTLSFGINYVQSNIVNKESKFAKLVRTTALSDSGIDFSENSSDDNGKGLYVLSGTEEDNYPIYYYRGAVENNNAKFAGFCWKIVRTTETGGTKLIYNGSPDENGQCTNTTGEATQLATTSVFTENYESMAYDGYMYGEVYESELQAQNNGYAYGNSFTYTNGVYTLSDTISGPDDTHHYTCFNSDVNATCESLSYVYYINSKVFYINLTDGKSVKDAIDEMHENTNDSTIKTVIDTWFNETFKPYFTNLNKDYNKYLEDTVWCNDRSMNTLGEYTSNGWQPNGGKITSQLVYGSFGRWRESQPSLTCINKNDAFTVKDTVNGNGALTYPVGLLTEDEVIIAGGIGKNQTYYLYTDQQWWTMSPEQTHIEDGTRYGMGVLFFDSIYFVRNDESQDYESKGVRPSISLKPEVKIAAGGDGTSASPYEFVVD